MRFFFFFKENIPSPFPLHNVRGSDGRTQRPWDFSPQASILSNPQSWTATSALKPSGPLRPVQILSPIIQFWGRRKLFPDRAGPGLRIVGALRPQSFYKCNIFIKPNVQMLTGHWARKHRSVATWHPPLPSEQQAGQHCSVALAPGSSDSLAQGDT